MCNIWYCSWRTLSLEFISVHKFFVGCMLLFRRKDLFVWDGSKFLIRRNHWLLRLLPGLCTLVLPSISTTWTTLLLLECSHTLAIRLANLTSLNEEHIQDGLVTWLDNYLSFKSKLSAFQFQICPFLNHHVLLRSLKWDEDKKNCFPSGSSYRWGSSKTKTHEISFF